MLRLEILRAPGGGAKTAHVRAAAGKAIRSLRIVLRGVNVRCFQRAAAILEFLLLPHSHGAFLEIIQRMRGDLDGVVIQEI